MKLIFVIASMFIADCANAQVSVTKSAIDPQTHLVVHFPPDWSVDGKVSTFTIVSFDGQKRPPQVMVPLNEAQITVTRPPEGVSSVPDWLYSDRVQTERGYRIRSVELTTDHFGIVNATEARDQPSVIEEGTIVIYYLDLRHRPVKVAMVYRGEKRAKHFESVLSAVVRTLTPKEPAQ